MIKMTAIYTQPENKVEFDKYYFDNHLPLAHKMPGLKKIEVEKVFSSPAGDTKYYLLAHMYFDSKESLDTALASPEGKACGKDLRNFTKNNVELVFSEIQN